MMVKRFNLTVGSHSGSLRVFRHFLTCIFDEGPAFDAQSLQFGRNLSYEQLSQALQTLHSSADTRIPVRGPYDLRTLVCPVAPGKTIACFAGASRRKSDDCCNCCKLWHVVLKPCGWWLWEVMSDIIENLRRVCQRSVLQKIQALHAPNLANNDGISGKVQALTNRLSELQAGNPHTQCIIFAPTSSVERLKLRC